MASVSLRVCPQPAGRRHVPRCAAARGMVADGSDPATVGRRYVWHRRGSQRRAASARGCGRGPGPRGRRRGRARTRSRRCSPCAGSVAVSVCRPRSPRASPSSPAPPCVAPSPLLRCRPPTRRGSPIPSHLVALRPFVIAISHQWSAPLARSMSSSLPCRHCGRVQSPAMSTPSRAIPGAKGASRVCLALDRLRRAAQDFGPMPLHELGARREAFAALQGVIPVQAREDRDVPVAATRRWSPRARDP